MTLPTSRGVVTALAVLLGVAGLGALAGAAPSARPSLVVTERAVVSAPGYWTRARMAAASGADAVPGATAVPEVSRASAGSGLAWTGGGAVARTTGRVFFTMAGTGYSCSGSVVASQHQDVVITAAHCVSDGAGRGSQVQVGAAVGGQQIEFGTRAAAEAVFGYPSEPPYTGRSLDYCRGTLQPDPYGLADEGIACAMTEGGSGGPWLSEFDPRTGLGVISGVTTFRYSGPDRLLFSAGLGPVAQALYERAASSLPLLAQG